MDMKKILENMDSAAAGDKPSVAGSNVNDMKTILESIQAVDECGPMVDEGPMPTIPAPEMDKGNPVTVSVSMNASGKEHVADLLDMMKNAGLGDAAPAADKMMSPRMDMERLSSIMDEPGFDDKEMPLPKGDEADMEEGGMKDAVTDMQEQLHDFAQEIQKGMHSYDNVVDELNDMFDEVKDMGDPIVTNAFKVLRSLEPEDFGEGEGGGPNRASMVAQDAMDMIDGSDDSDYDHLPNLEGYANEPDEKYDDHEVMIKDLSGGINREKKSYKAAQRGDNPMATESIKSKLWAALAEKKMPMGAGPDGKKGTDDDKPAFLNQKTGDKKSKGGSKPKKGVVPPQFQKK